MRLSGRFRSGNDSCGCVCVCVFVPPPPKKMEKNTDIMFWNEALQILLRAGY